MQVRPILRSVAAATGGFAEIRGNFRLLQAGNHFRQQASLYRLPSSLSSLSVARFQGQPFYATTSDRVSLNRVVQARPPNRLRWVSLTRRSMSTGEEHDTPSTASDIKELKTPQDIIDFWFADEKRFAEDKEYEQSLTGKWYGFGPKDESFIETQHAAKELMVKAASGELKGGDWDEPKGALAKILLLDQFPRTVYRGTKEAFAQDETAASLALEVISKDWDVLGVNYSFPQRMFIYMPLMHSERLEAHDVCVEKMSILHKEEAEEKGEPPKPNDFATDHREVVAKFGRFPHRNAALGRESTPEEIEWLQSDDIPSWAKSQMS